MQDDCDELEAERDVLKARVAELEAERDDYKVHFEEADKQRLAAIDRVVELEAQLRVDKAADEISVLINGDKGWEYPGQLVRAVGDLIRDRAQVIGRMAALERRHSAAVAECAKAKDDLDENRSACVRLKARVAELEAEAKPESNAPLVARCNELARELYGILGYKVSEGYGFHVATHPQERMVWRMAVVAFELLDATDMDDVTTEYMEEPDERKEGD
jgi:hypothetical protein